MKAIWVIVHIVNVLYLFIIIVMMQTDENIYILMVTPLK